ncbi:helix-turn-helix domain-containing protein [uncultured Lutibacter sp.]|uniref:TetR/AcrR family transcriptional regulator n=1 Tax=uncultured Lutibacter sp. TaxID=437739 RepID=UPI00260E94A1|nr:helix-turn-helix domain-containing protein [uncultured Lutibacter sp.]
MDSTKKDLILQTALELFSEYGTQQTTMDAIANDCEISKKTIYKYFNNKSDLINRVFETLNI